MELHLGNLGAQRDWGHARDFVEGMWRILQQDEADDCVLATGEMHSVREFCEAAFSELGRSIVWRGEGIEEKGYDEKSGDCLIEVDPHYFRPTEVEKLLGDASKAREKLGWEHRSTFPELVAEMVLEDLSLLKTERLARRAYGVVE